MVQLITTGDTVRNFGRSLRQPGGLSGVVSFRGVRELKYIQSGPRKALQLEHLPKYRRYRETLSDKVEAFQGMRSSAVEDFQLTFFFKQSDMFFVTCARSSHLEEFSDHSHPRSFKVTRNDNFLSFRVPQPNVDYTCTYWRTYDRKKFGDIDISLLREH